MIARECTEGTRHLLCAPPLPPPAQEQEAAERCQQHSGQCREHDDKDEPPVRSDAGLRCCSNGWCRRGRRRNPGRACSLQQEVLKRRTARGGMGVQASEKACRHGGGLAADAQHLLLPPHRLHSG